MCLALLLDIYLFFCGSLPRRACPVLRGWGVGLGLLRVLLKLIKIKIDHDLHNIPVFVVFPLNIYLKHIPFFLVFSLNILFKEILSITIFVFFFFEYLLIHRYSAQLPADRNSQKNTEKIGATPNQRIKKRENGFVVVQTPFILSLTPKTPHPSPPI